MMEMPACRLVGRLLFFVLLALGTGERLVAADGSASFPKTTLVQDVVYRADGSPANGWMVISWPAFVTSDGAAVAAGSTSVKLGGDGRFSVALAPNAGATPTGSYYAVTLKLDGGTTSKEAWVVPMASPASLGAVRASVAPSTMAVQALTADWANSNLVNLSEAQAISGVKSFAQPPSVPTPVNASDAANKAYVDANAGGGVNVARITSANTWTQPQTFSSAVMMDVKEFPLTAFGAVSGQDSTAAINAAMAAIAAVGGGSLILPPGVWKYSGTLTPPNVPFSIEGRAKSRRYQNSGQQSAILEFTQTTKTDGISITSARSSTSYFGMDGVEVIGNSSMAHCIHINGYPNFGGGSMLIRNVQAEGCGGDGWHFDNLYDAVLSNIQALSNVGDGLYIGNGSNNTIEGVSEFTGSGGHGIHLGSGVSNSFLGVDVSANKGCGISMDGATSSETSQNRVTGYWESTTNNPNALPACLGAYSYNNDLSGLWISQGASISDTGVGNIYTQGQGAAAAKRRDVTYTNIATNSSFTNSTVSGSQGMAGLNGQGTVTASIAQDATTGVATGTSAKIVVTSVSGVDQQLFASEALGVPAATGDVWVYRFFMKANRAIKSMSDGGGLQGMKVYFSTANGSFLPNTFAFPYIDTNWRQVCLYGQFASAQNFNVGFASFNPQAGDNYWVTDRTLAKIPAAAYNGGNPCEIPYVQTGATAGTHQAGLVLTNNANTWAQPQAFGSSCPQPATGIGAAGVNGVLNAACFSGSDWAAKTTSAIATLPLGGGTVFIPASLANGTSVGGLSLPANVNLEFDSGTYTLGGALTINGAGHRIEGKSASATTLQFAGATDGIVFPDTIPLEKRTLIENLSLVGTNASGGKAFNAWDATTIPPTNIVMRNVKIATSGAGAWAYGFYTSNMQFCSFYDVTITGKVAVGLHLENSTNEDVFVNVFVINGGQTRAAEFYGGSINSDELTFINGGFQGSGAVYVAGGSWVYMLGTHFEAITPTGSDAAAVVVDSGNLRWSSTNGAVSLTAKNASDVKVVTSQLGDVTIDSTSMGSIVNSSMRSLTNNSNNFALFGNSIWSSGATNAMTVGQFTLSNSAGSGQVIFSRLGTAGLAITQGAGSRITIGAGFALGFATSGVASEDTFVSRSAAGTLKLGTSNNGSDGTLLLGKIAGTGSATFAAGAAAGSSPGTPVCASGHVCDSYSGTISFTVGSATGTGALLTVTTGVTRTNTPNCMVQAYLAASPYTQVPVRDAGSTTTVVFSTGIAPTASAPYELKYICPGI